jgi:hypothetical protein
MAHPIETFQPHSDGDFLSQNFSHHDVRNIRSISQDRSIHGVTFHQEEYTVDWENNDGQEESRRYIVTSSTIPEFRKYDASDIASLETSAWLTKFGGLNKRRQIALARDYRTPSTFIGVQQNKSHIGHIEDNSANHLFIASHVAERFDRDSSQLLLQGISRGAMHGLTTQSIAQRHGISVLYSDNIVPCFPEGLNVRTDLTEYIKFIPNEYKSLRSLKLPLKILMSYPDTVDASAMGMFQQMKEVPTLLSNTMGGLIEDELPRDSFGYIAAYGGDIMSQGNRWVTKIDDRFKNMVVDLSPDGAHMSCISADCHSQWRQRIETITGLLHEDRSRVAIGATALRELAALKNPVFEKAAQPSPPSLPTAA